jgi:Flp pilus assembly pilin Flp
MSNLMHLLAALRADRKGVTTVEYAVLAFVIIGIVGVAGVALQGELSTLFSGLGQAVNTAAGKVGN